MDLATKILVGLNRIFPKPERPCSRHPEPGELIYPTDPATIEYVDGQIDRGNHLYEEYKHYVNFDNKVIVDIGCGLGGATHSYSKKGDNLVVGMDIKYFSLKEGKKYIQKYHGKSTGMELVNGSATSLPLKSESVDIAVANDFMEHVSNPQMAIQETIRIVKEEGFFFFEFPAYSAPRAYHMLYTIYTPWCHVLFSEETLVKAAKEIAARENYFWVLHPDWEQLYYKGLNKLSIKDFISILLRQKDIKLIRLGFNAFNKFLQPLVYLRGINEFFCSRIVCVLQKSYGSSVSRNDIRTQLIDDFKRKLLRFKNENQKRFIN